MTLELQGRFYKKLHHISGRIDIYTNIEIPSRKRLTTTLKVEKGELLENRIFKFNYTNEDTGILQKGSAVLELNASGNELYGYFVGYSPVLEKITTGYIYLVHYTLWEQKN